jgi:hypothetical protein
MGRIGRVLLFVPLLHEKTKGERRMMERRSKDPPHPPYPP